MSLTRAWDRHLKTHDGIPILQEIETTDPGSVRYIAGNKILRKQYECMACHEIITVHVTIKVEK